MIPAVQEIVDEANKPDSAIRLQRVILDSDALGEKTVTVVSQSILASQLGIRPEQSTSSTHTPEETASPAFATAEDQVVAQIAYQAIRTFENHFRASRSRMTASFRSLSE